MQCYEITKSDIRELADVFRIVFNAEPWNDNWTIQTAFNRISIQLSNKNCIGWKAIEKNKILGFVIGYITGLPNGKGFFVEDLCVLPDEQKRGIGKDLIETMEKSIMKIDIKTVITTTAKGLSAYEFYIKNGFIDNHTTVGLYKRLG